MGGGGKKAEVPAAKTSEQIAQEQLQAHQSTDPAMAALNWSILNNPTYGMQAQTQLAENTRRNVYGQEAGLSDVLIQQTLQQLMSPTSMTPEQQAAVDSRRQLATNQYTEQARNRANLGGGLYGGRSAQAENMGVGNLQNMFVEEDLQRQERIRNNALQTALSIYGGYRGAPLQTPQYQSVTPDPNAQLNAYTQNAQLQFQQQQAQAAQQAQMRSALYGALGTAAGMALAPMTGGLSLAGSQYLMPGGYTPNTPAGVRDMGTYSTLGR